MDEERGREDAFPVPKVPAGKRYEFKPRHTLVLIKDSASAATRAAEIVWPDTVIHEAECMTHADILWSGNNASKFRKQQNKKAISRDLQYRYKVIGHINLVPYAKVKMEEKWRKERKEPEVADGWFSSWRNSNLTRIENCQEHICPLRGGVPCDNNAVEAGNSADKKALDYQKNTLFDFVDEVGTVLVGEVSLEDTAFENKLKRSWRHKKGLNKAVYNIEYFKHARQIEEMDKMGLPTFLHCQFRYTSIKNDVPEGSFLVMGQRCLSEMERINNSEDNDIDLEAELSDKEACKKFLGGRGNDRWVNLYKSIISHPEIMTKEMSFDQLCNWDKTFHIIRPIVPDNGGPKEKATFASSIC